MYAKVRFYLGFAILIASLFFMDREAGVSAQERNGWSEPIQLSSDGADASEGLLISDKFGFTHVFWIESNLPDQRTIIQYSRFDGQEWTPAVDIYASEPRGIVNFLSPAVDDSGLLHLIWTAGNTGPLFYMTVPVMDATSAQKWSVPLRIDLPAYEPKLRLGLNGELHLLYSEFYGQQKGVYYSNSHDGGISWSEPVRLDLVIPNNQAPLTIKFAQDETGGLHAVWHYLDLNENIGASVLYANSIDGGETWSIPILIDEPDESPRELRMARPSLVVNDGAVHVIWAGTELTNREYRSSTDRGKTWSQTIRLFGELHGQAIGDGIAVDALGRIHFIGQIRWPQGIYHAYLSRGQWSLPQMAYLMAENHEDPFGNRISAHRVRLAIRAGNQLVVSFTDSPTDDEHRLFAIYRTLEDVTSSSVLPIPVPTSLAAPQGETAGNELTNSNINIPVGQVETESQIPGITTTNLPATTTYPWMALILPILVLFLVVIYRLIWIRAKT